MELSSELFSNGCTSWQRVLLTASLLTCWLLPTTTQVDIESLPPQVVEGENVLLRVDNLPENLLAFSWYRGLKNWQLAIALHLLDYNTSMTGPDHSDREILYSNGSLWIQNVTKEDTGYYTLRTISKHGELVSNTSTFLQVYSSHFTCGRPSFPAKLTIESVPPRVAEGGRVLLRVHNLPEYLQLFFWYKGVIMIHKVEIVRYRTLKNLSDPGPAHSGRETVFSNGSLLLHNVTQKDTGFYTIRTLNRHGKIVSTTSIYLHVYTFFWTCGPLSPSAQLTIESVPPKVAEGGSVLLVVHNLQGNLRSLFWYKGMIVSRNLEVARHIIDTNLSVHGPLHSGRETIYSNGSLMFYNVTWKDSGLYTLRTLSTDMKTELAHVQLQVDASLSPCCNPLTSSQLMIEPVPRYAVEGESVLFMVHNLPKDLQTFSWYKSVYGAEILKITEYSRAMSSTTRGSELKRRERVYTNGFLLLQNATEKDAGMYILETLSRDFKIEKAQVQLYVNKPVSQPFIRVTNTTVTIQSSVVLTCLSADTGIFIHWIFNNQSLQLTERMTLSPTKCQLSIDPVRKEDAGEYQCEVSNPVSSQTSLPVSLAVTNE